MECHRKKLEGKQIKQINNLLASIIEFKENICEVVNRQCSICPLNVEDKCNELNLPEFDFDKHKWL